MGVLAFIAEPDFLAIREKDEGDVELVGVT